MSYLILGEYDENPTTISLETSKRTTIKNYQYGLLVSFEIADAERLENQFASKFQGDPNPLYNCHGLTFASKRTGVYEDTEVWKIIKDEYFEIKSDKEVLIGDILIYYDNDNGILHSAIVVKAENSNPADLADIWVLSKIRKHKEIVHNYNFSPYGGEKRFYRIRHEFRIIQ